MRINDSKSEFVYAKTQKTFQRKIHSKKDLQKGDSETKKKGKWLPNKDSNLNKLNQNQLCYRYTIGHRICNVH